ncbi:MAG: hypothetical protein ACOZCL_12600 [Bacillota bacterium]
MYDFKLIPNKRIFQVEVSGTIDIIEGSKIIEELRSRLKSINASEYVLVLDGRTVKPASILVIPSIHSFINTCYNAPFKKFIFIGDDNLNTYAASMIKSYNHADKKIILVKSTEEAMKHF